MNEIGGKKSQRTTTNILETGHIDIKAENAQDRD